MIHNFTWPLYPISPGFYKVVPREVEDNGYAFFFFFLFFWRGRGLQNMDYGLGENSEYGQNELG